jgi:transcriptional regulator with XRE-family HTH domain
MGLNDNIVALIEAGPTDVKRRISSRVREIRLEKNLTQEGLAKKAGMKFSTYVKFERTGEISLSKLLNIAAALSCLSDFDNLFSSEDYRFFDETIPRPKERKRGKLK